MKTDELKALLTEHQARTERYIGALKEDFDQRVHALLEAVKDVRKIKETLDRGWHRGRT